MSIVSRRGFLGKASAGAAAVGAIALLPEVATSVEAAPALPHITKRELAGPLVLHVRNVSTGEVALMVGSREIVYKDRALVARLTKAAR